MIPGGIKIRLLLEAKYGDDPLLDPVPWYLLKPRLFFYLFQDFWSNPFIYKTCYDYEAGNGIDKKPGPKPLQEKKKKKKIDDGIMTTKHGIISVK